jgi:hypothetical protein
MAKKTKTLDVQNKSIYIPTLQIATLIALHKLSSLFFLIGNVGVMVVL